jgi:ribosomal protein S2
MYLYKLLIMQKLLDAKAHLGFCSSYSDTQPYIYGFRNKIAIIDLEKTLICLRRACNVIDLIIRSKGHLLFVNTNPEYNNIVKQTAMRANQSFINHKWIGGFLTNWNHMQNVQQHFASHLAPLSTLRASGPAARPSLTSVPDCVIIFNANQNSIAIHEASLLQIPIISLVDSNISNKLHSLITYPIPANHDSVRLIYIVCNCFLKTILLSRHRTDLSYY